MWAWRAILKHMGLQHKMTHSQASKKWENMKKKYKELKNPPDGVKVFPHGWPYFSLMDDAMEGRLAGDAPILKALPGDNDSCDFLPISRPKKRKASRMTDSSVASLTGRPETEVSLNGDEDVEEEAAAAHTERQEINRIMQEVEHERSMMEIERQVMESEKQMMEREKQVMESEKQVMEREKQVMERERLVLQRERAVLDREIAALDRDRALLERERATVEREKVLVEKDRDAVNRDRVALEREKARLGRLSATKEGTEELTEDSSTVQDPGVTDRKERFLSLFEKLIEKF
ncbi:caldesmon [Pempheris klunzingeri]|uniref:caldesmon n=1 Tax=Pempheris klunzingeri TaxID=3127111 RepID=UPI00397F84FE